MNFRDIDVNGSYLSKGDNNITDALIIPALKCCKLYKRSVGFFSSSVIESVLDGVVSLYRNGGKIQLVASPYLSKEDSEAIKLGYKEREKTMSDQFSEDFSQAINQCEDESLEILSILIAQGVLDIKLAVVDGCYMYHDKFGILEDFDGNMIVFYGSPNSSHSGYQGNYEKIRVVNNWTEGQIASVEDELDEFQKLWYNTNPYLSVYSFSQSEKKNLIKTIEKARNEKRAGKNNGFKLRDYQTEAINAWIKNNYHGFYVMATGTGKTLTALYANKKLQEAHPATTVIVAPYKHLVRQWAEDVQNVFPDARIVLVSSENPGWSGEIKREVLNKKLGIDRQLIIISTIKSFLADRFEASLKQLKEDRVLIVDEAHRFSCREEYITQKYNYMLGLSATPFRGTSAASGYELMRFFGGQVYSLSLEDALEKKCLVPYNYYPIIVYATAEEEASFTNLTNVMASCFINGVLIDKDKLIRAHRSRLRVLSMADKKMENLESIIQRINVHDHFIVYCGDGRLYDEDKDEMIRHIDSVKKVLNNLGYKPSQFTASENISQRMSLVDAFNKGEISALAAIRCLDEGINIPSITNALILSSNDDYREFVQRRGRILRKFEMKTEANIYDVVVLPSTWLSAWAKIELRRMYEYAKLALNKEEQIRNIDSLLNDYHLKREDIEVYDYEDMEDEMDE